MGTGFGVYLYKENVIGTELVDDGLRPGVTYAYRIDHQAQEQNQALGFVSVAPFNRAPVAGAGLASALTTDSASKRPNQAIIPAPTPLPADALLLGLISDASYTDEFNTLNVVGEVRNDSNLDVGEVTVVVSFYDTTGNFLSEARDQTMLDHLQPGERSPFLLNLTRPVGMSNYSIKAVGRPVPPQLTSQVAVVQSKAYQDDIGFYHVTGIIENTGSILVQRAKVVVTLYGRGGGVINVGFDYPTPARLAPAERAAFDVKFTYFPHVLEHRIDVR